MLTEKDQLTPISTCTFPFHKTLWDERGGFRCDIPPPQALNQRFTNQQIKGDCEIPAREANSEIKWISLLYRNPRNAARVCFCCGLLSSNIMVLHLPETYGYVHLCKPTQNSSPPHTALLNRLCWFQQTQCFPGSKGVHPNILPSRLKMKQQTSSSHQKQADTFV